MCQALSVLLILMCIKFYLFITYINISFSQQPHYTNKVKCLRSGSREVEPEMGFLGRAFYRGNERSEGSCENPGI